MPASFAFRINALHSPTRQILHASPPYFGGLQVPACRQARSPRPLFRRPTLPSPWQASKARACSNDAQTFPFLPPEPGKNWKVAVILRRVSCGVKQIDTIPSGSVARPIGVVRRHARGTSIFSAENADALYNLLLLAHNHSFRARKAKGRNIFG
jgi:hypothetical protein